jgi:Cobalamin synthesis protein cobW C-terminal domain
MLMMMGYTGTNGIEKGWAPDEKRINRWLRHGPTRRLAPLRVTACALASAAGSNHLNGRAANFHVTNCRLVFIGRNLDAEELNASFRNCLVDNLVISG